MVRQGLRMKEQMDEIVSVSKKIKTRDYQSSAVILDFSKRQVEIASMDGVTLPKDFQKIRDYYYQHYSKVIDDLEAQWRPPESNAISPDKEIVST